MRKKKVKELGPLDDLDGQIMIMAAHRYCLGRHTYVVPACIDWLKKWWDKFEGNTKAVIVRDTIEELQDHTWGSPLYDMDAKLWKHFAEWAYNKLTEEEQKWCRDAVAHRNKPWPIDSF